MMRCEGKVLFVRAYRGGIMIQCKGGVFFARANIYLRGHIEA